MKSIERAFFEFILDRGFRIKRRGTFLGLDLEADYHIRSLDAFLKEEKDDLLATRQEAIDGEDLIEAPLRGLVSREPLK